MKILQLQDLDNNTIKINPQGKIQTGIILDKVTPPRLKTPREVAPYFQSTQWLKITLPDGQVGYTPFYAVDTTPYTDDNDPFYWDIPQMIYANQVVNSYVQNNGNQPWGGMPFGTTYQSINLPSWIELNSQTGVLNIQMPIDPSLTAAHSYQVQANYLDGSTDIIPVEFNATGTLIADTNNPNLPAFSTITGATGGPIIQGISNLNQVSNITFQHYQLAYYSSGTVGISYAHQPVTLQGVATVYYMDNSQGTFPYEVNLRASPFQSYYSCGSNEDLDLDPLYVDNTFQITCTGLPQGGTFDPVTWKVHIPGSALPLGEVIHLGFQITPQYGTSVDQYSEVQVQW